MKKIIRVVLLIFVILLLIFILGVIITRIITTGIASSLIFSVEQVPQSRVAVVFGAGLQRDGTPTTVLRDRVTTAVELYHFGKVQKLLMSGDNRFLDYNEPASMREYAINLGVPTEDIVLDYAGRRTYDTCYRALHIFNVKDVILVTQDFHLPRALYICNVLGLNAVGVKADLRRYTSYSLFVWNVREVVANATAFFDLYVLHPLPILGPQEPIFPDEASAAPNVLDN